MSKGMTTRPTNPGIAPCQLPVLANGVAPARARAVEWTSSLPDPPGVPSDRSPLPPPHPSLTALARLLARQISRSEGGDG